MSGILAIDPSINDLGLALIDADGTFVLSKHLSPDKDQRGNSCEKIASLFAKVELELSEHSKQISEVVIEHTRFFARSNNQSHASAQKLNLVKGMLYGLCRRHLEVPVHLVWIPGFSKDEANLVARAGKLPQKITQHERDAYWLATTWQKTPEPMRGPFLRHKDF